MKYACLVILVLTMILPGLADQSKEDGIVRIGDWPISVEDGPLQKYGDGKPFMEWPARIGYQCMMWKVGDGVLVLEITYGMLRIGMMTYVVNDKEGKPIAVLPVKEFNPKTGDMTITVPNKASEVTINPAPKAQD